MNTTFIITLLALQLFCVSVLAMYMMLNAENLYETEKTCNKLGATVGIGNAYKIVICFSVVLAPILIVLECFIKLQKRLKKAKVKTVTTDDHVTLIFSPLVVDQMPIFVEELELEGLSINSAYMKKLVRFIDKMAKDINLSSEKIECFYDASSITIVIFHPNKTIILKQLSDYIKAIELDNYLVSIK